MNSQSIRACLTPCLLLIFVVDGLALAQQERWQESPVSLARPTPLADSSPPEQKQGLPQTDPSVPVPSSRPVSARAFLKNTWVDQKTIWTAPFHPKNYDWRFLLPFTMVTAGLIASDKAVAREVSESPPGTGFAVSRRISQIGSPAVDYAVAGAFYGVGLLTENNQVRETGLLGLEALVNSTIVSALLKVATQRERPTRDQGRQRLDDARGRFAQRGTSFPSGHALAAWSLASVMAARYPDRPAIEYSAYGLAALISVSRITARKHFPSDALVGGVLGYLIGHYVVRAHAPPGQKRGRLTPLILPHVDEGRRQYGFSVQFQF